MHKIKVGKTGSAYFSDDLRAEGYVGELEARPNACALVILKPGAKLRHVIRSLEILKEDFQHRIEMGEE